MPPVVNVHKCSGCAPREESRCEEVCPGDLMAVDVASGKAYCRNPRDCWDCMSCVKACPNGALATRMPYQLGYFKASLRPVMGKDVITWKCVDIYGKERTYKYRNRIIPDT